MYSNTPRLDATNFSQTGDSIGPNTYIICNGGRFKENCAPFLSSAPRDPSFIQKLNTHALYNIDDLNRKIKGGASLKSKSRRFDYVRADDNILIKHMRCNANKNSITTEVPAPSEGKLYLCRVPYTVFTQTPSVPTTIDKNGYDIDVKGNLIKIPSDRPLFNRRRRYYPRSTLDSGRGCKWSGWRSDRFPVKCEQAPGPGDYDLHNSVCCKNEADEKFREMARRLAFIPRYIEAQGLKAQLNSLPGPGYYDINDDMTRHLRSQSIRPRPLITQEQRFKAKYQNTPSPGDYQINDKYARVEQSSVKCCPSSFGSTAGRFKIRKCDDHVMPGPASYSIKSPLLERLESKKNPYSTTNPPFNNTAERNITFVSADLLLTPAATDYPIDVEDDEAEEIERRRIQHFTYVFRSCTKRFPKLKLTDITVNPASYNISEPFNKNRNRKSHNTGKVPFHLSSQQDRGLGKFFEYPGPTDHVSNNSRNCNDGYAFNKSRRFAIDGDDYKPGPGTYQIHPSVDSSLHRACNTHNARLQASICNKVLSKSIRRHLKTLVKDVKST